MMTGTTKPRAGTAAYYRAHREAFLRALELGITPKEAASRIENDKARLRWLAGRHRAAAKGIPIALPTDTASGPPADASDRWMMRD